MKKLLKYLKKKLTLTPAAKKYKQRLESCQYLLQLEKEQNAYLKENNKELRAFKERVSIALAMYRGF